MTESSFRRLLSLCLSESCRSRLELGLGNQHGERHIFMSLPARPCGEPTFLATDRTHVRLGSRDSLRRWMLLHPAGTTFIWSDRSSPVFQQHALPGEWHRYFGEIEAFAKSQGMKLTMRE